MVFNIETRRIQMTGGSTFIISLPKKWITANKINKNDTLGILTQPDGNLLITPKINPEETLRTKEINADDFKDYNFLFRICIAAYLQGFSRWIIKSSKKFESYVTECITDFTRIAIGPEIIEESNTYIVIKDLLNPKEMPFEKTIRRMYILAESMHEDSINALINKDRGLAEQVIKRDNDVDRLHWLIGRQSSIVLRDIILSQKMGITLEDANHYQIMSRFLERIADHAARIATNVLIIMENSIDVEIVERISNASKISMNLLTNSLDAWLKKDINMANENIESIKDLISACEEVSFNPNHDSVESYIAVSYIVESIRRTGEYAGDISEIIINNIVKE